MTDWGFGSAVKSLYGGPSATERSKNEMATIGVMENQFVKENAEKEAGQLKKEAYDREVQDFANKLLGPDRDKINQRAKILQAGVRDQIKYYGGDMTKFFANGGHKIMNDYRSQVVNSVEATEYLENQKNAMQLTAIQMSGKGGLINPNDLQSLKDYNENKGGKITYTGMMNEIKMPDASKYQYGQEIPPEDIYRENKFAIDGNFVMVHGRPPSDALEAVNFTKMTYGNKGSNWQYGFQQEQEKTRVQEKVMDTETKRMADYYEYLAKMAKATQKTTKITDVNGNEVEVFDNTMPGYKSPDELDYKGRQGMTELASSETLRSIANLGENVSYTDFISGKAFHGNQAKLFDQNSQPVADGEFSYYDQSIPENNLTFSGYSKDKKDGLNSKIGNLFNNQFAPVNARKLYGVQAPVAAQGILKVSDTKVYDPATKIYKGFQPDENDFRANGSAYKNNSDPVNYEELKGDWKVKAVISVGIGQDKDGNESIVMNQMDGKKVHKKNNEHLIAEYQNGTIKMHQAVVLEDAFGNVVYRTAPNNTDTATAIHTAMKDNDDRMPVNQSFFNNEGNNQSKTKEAEMAKKDLKGFWDVNANDALTKRSIQTQANLFSTGGVTIKRNDLLNGFYGVVAMGAGVTKPNDFRDNIINNPKTQFTNYVMDLQNEGFPMQETLKSAKSDADVIIAIMDWSRRNGQDSEMPFLQSWLEHVTVVNKYRTE